MTSDRWKLRPNEPATRTVPTEEATLERMNARKHRLSREETAAWNAANEHAREEARDAIREAVREQGGGELYDASGKRLEVVSASGR